MFKRRFMPVWIGLIFLSGMFLMGQDAWPPCTDLDGDGYGNPDDPGCTYPDLDCDDTNPDVYPGALELCDGIDNQCPGDFCYGEVDAHCGSPAPGMANIPCGCFEMGDSSDSCSMSVFECPVHNVCITSFMMDVYEVTNAKYRACVEAEACSPPSDIGWGDHNYDNPAYNAHPVTWVNWYQANYYCTWKGKRLPTEAEWEYAARGGLAGKRYPWGDTISCSDANIQGCVSDTTVRGSYPPNGYGLYDMVGNVYEWGNDWFQQDYYSVSPTNDPPGPVEPQGGARTRRGGSFTEPWFSNRVASRYTTGWPNDEIYDLGFRCAAGGAFGP